MDVLVRLRALLGVNFCLRAAFGAVLVVLGAHVQIDARLYGALIALTPFVELITVPFIGLASDRFGHRKVLLVGLSVAVVAMAIRVTTLEWGAVATANALHGLAAAATLVPSLALVAELAPPGQRGRAMGAFDFVNVFGAFLGYIVGFALATADPRIAFGAITALLTVALVWAIREIPAPGRTTAGVRLSHLFGVLRHPNVVLVVAPWLIVFTFIGGFVAFFPQDALLRYGFDRLTTVIIVSIAGVVIGLSQIFYGQLSDRVGRGPLLLLGAGGFAVVMVAVAILFLAADGDDARFLQLFRSALPLLLPALLAGLAFGPASLAALADAAEHEPTGLTMSLYSVVLSLGYTLGPTLLGIAKDPIVGGPAGLALYHVLLGIGLVTLVVARQWWMAKRTSRFWA